MNHPLVSVVTPFYNTEAFLAECIESVLAQTYTNWEYVLVDNCSTDGSLSIAKRYANKDSRIRLIEAREFVAQVPNYNRALRAISDRSTFTKMVEADNWLYPNCLERMVDLASANPSVGLVGSYNITEAVVRFHGARYRQNVYSGRDAASLYFLDGAYLFGSPTTVLIRSAEVRARTPFFPEDGIYGEDLRVFFDILRRADFGFVHQILTFVRTSNESILSKIKDFDAMTLDRFIVLKSLGAYFLDEQAFERCLKNTRAQAYHRLALGLLQGKGSRFWRFHERGLESIGESPRRLRLGVCMFLVLVQWALSPGLAAAALVRRLKRRDAA